MVDSLVDLKFKGIDRQIKRYTKVAETVDNPRMMPLVRAVGRVWRDNFNSEGRMVGGWRELSEMTRLVRSQRGYNPAHPILKQSGALYHAAIEAPVNGRRNVSADGAHYSLTDGRRKVDLRIEGTKVTNQFRQRGGTRGGRWSSPPRRFWFVSPEVVKAAKDALFKEIQTQLREVR